jgi:predicted RNA-binding Zn ribbon-like protein
MERFGPTRRGGPVFRWLGESLAIDLANTVMVVRTGEVIDLLASVEDFESWLTHERPRLGDCAFALPHLAEVRALRGDVRALLVAAADDERLPAPAVERVNVLSAGAPVAPLLEIDDDTRTHLVERGDEVGGLPGLLGTLARSAIRQVAGPQSAPLQICNAPSCGMFFVGRRRWCCSACGNRARAARHYQRRTGSAKDG